MSERELSGKFVVGEFAGTEAPELSQLYVELFKVASLDSN